MNKVQTSISALLLSGCPSDIARLVMTVVIYSVYAVTWRRSQPYVC